MSWKSCRAGVSLLLGAGLLAIATAAPAAQRVIALSAAQLQSGVNEYFPQRRCVLGLACLTLVEPRVRLIDGDPRVYLTAVAVPEVAGDRLRRGVVEARGAPRYEPAHGAFYLDRPDMTRIEFPDLPPASASTAADIVRLLLAELAREPVWRLDERDGRQALAKLVLRGIEVRGGQLLLKVGDEGETPLPDENEEAK